MSVYMNGHGQVITNGTNGIRTAECTCGKPIHKRMPNRKHQNITLEQFMREANAKHQQHLNNIIERERLKTLLNAKYGKHPTKYKETDSMKDIEDLVKEYARLEIQELQVRQRKIQIIADINEFIKDLTK